MTSAVLLLIRPSRAFGFFEAAHTVSAGVADHLSPTNAEITAYIETIKAGAAHEDAHDHLWAHLFSASAHFWDADAGLTEPTPYDVANAWQKAQIYWGMALGEYSSGHKARAYEYLGHVAHLLSDMSLPAHAHNDNHGVLGGDDCYEEWMTGEKATPTPFQEYWMELHPLTIPDSADYPLYYLFYTTNQVADFFASDDANGDATTGASYTGDEAAWMAAIYAEDHPVAGPMNSVVSPRDSSDLADNDYDWNWLTDDNNNNDGDLSEIREYAHLYGLRAVGALYHLFATETGSSHRLLNVVIDKVDERDAWYDSFPHDGVSDPDYYVRVRIGDDAQLGGPFWFRNEGDRILNDDSITPGWSFARTVGSDGMVPVTIELWDQDAEPVNPNDRSDIFYGAGTGYAMYVDLATGKLWRNADRTGFIGTAGTQVYTYGTARPASKLWFTVLLPGLPTPPATGPTVSDIPDQTVLEGQGFAQIHLDDYVTDPDGGAVTWSFNDDEGRELGVSIDPVTGVATIAAPGPDWSGAETVVFTATDSSLLDDSHAVLFTVTDVNDPPSFTAGDDQTVLEDAGAQEVAGWATGVLAGPEKEGGQALSFEVVGNTAPELFSVEPTISVAPVEDGAGEAAYRTTLRYTPAANANGSADISVVLRDDGLTESGGDDASDPQTFTITITPVNDAPLLTGVPDVTFDEDLTDSTLDLDGYFADIETTASAAAFAVEGGTNVHAAIDPLTHVVTFSAEKDWNGSETLTFVATDGGDGADAPLSARDDVLVTVDPVNDAPYGDLDDSGLKTQTVQYTDAIQQVFITAHDVDSPDSELTADATGLPGGVTFGPALDQDGNAIAGRWVVSGSVDAPAGSYCATVTVSDGELPSAPITFTVVVAPEDASVSYSGDTLGVVGVGLALRATVLDSAAASYGSHGAEPGGTLGELTRLWVEFVIRTDAGSPAAVVRTRVVDTGAPGDGIGAASAQWTSPVDDGYLVTVRVVAEDGGINRFYAADPSPEAVVSVYEDCGQFVTGGGWVPDPDTGGHGNFGFNARYGNKGKAQGRFLYLWRGTYGGEPADFRIVSNAITGLSYAGSEFPISATLTGKASLQVVSAINGELLYVEGNLPFFAVVLDTGKDSDIPDTLSLSVAGSLPKAFPEAALLGGGVVVHLE